MPSGRARPADAPRALHSRRAPRQHLPKMPKCKHFGIRAVPARRSSTSSLRSPPARWSARAMLVSRPCLVFWLPYSAALFTAMWPRPAAIVTNRIRNLHRPHFGEGASRGSRYGATSQKCIRLEGAAYVDSRSSTASPRTSGSCQPPRRGPIGPNLEPEHSRASQRRVGPPR